MGQPAEKLPLTAEDSFRQALEDVADVVRAIGPHCRDTDGLVAVVEAAMHSEDQLYFLMSLVQQARKRTR